jgi:hypothetical protein
MEFLGEGQYIYVLESVISPCLIKIGKTEIKIKKSKSQGRIAGLALHGYQGVTFKRVLAIWKIDGSLSKAESLIGEKATHQEKGNARKIGSTELFVFKSEESMKNFVSFEISKIEGFVTRVKNEIISDINRCDFDDWKDMNSYYSKKNTDKKTRSNVSKTSKEKQVLKSDKTDKESTKQKNNSKNIKNYADITNQKHKETADIARELIKVVPEKELEVLGIKKDITK